MKTTFAKTFKGLSVMALICAAGVSTMGYTNVSAMQIELMREQATYINQPASSETDTVKENTQPEDSSVQTSKNEQNEHESILAANNVKIQYPKADDKEFLLYENAEAFLEGLKIDEWKESDMLPESTSPNVFLIEETVPGHSDEFETVANLRYFPEEKCVAVTSGKGMPDEPESFTMQQNNTSVYKVSEETIHFLEAVLNQ